jgi:hypothetical protein
MEDQYVRGELPKVKPPPGKANAARLGEGSGAASQIGSNGRGHRNLPRAFITRLADFRPAKILTYRCRAHEPRKRSRRP